MKGSRIDIVVEVNQEPLLPILSLTKDAGMHAHGGLDLNRGRRACRPLNGPAKNQPLIWIGILVVGSIQSGRQIDHFSLPERVGHSCGQGTCAARTGENGPGNLCLVARQFYAYSWS